MSDSDVSMSAGPASPIRVDEARLLQSTDASPPSPLDQILQTLSSLSKDMASMKETVNHLQKGEKRKPNPIDKNSGAKKAKTASPSPLPERAVEPSAHTATAVEPSAHTSTADSDCDMADTLRTIMETEGKEEEEERKEEDSEADELLASFSAALETAEQTGPPVSDKMAAIMKNYGKKVEDSKLKTMLAKYKIPDNCPSLGVPRTNQEVRTALTSAAKTADTRLWNTQWTIAHAATALVQCSDLIMQVNKSLAQGQATHRENRAKLAECAEKMADALALTGHATFDLSLKRREIHRPCLPRDSAGLCAPHVSLDSQWLYPTGSDFHRALKEAKDAQKLSHTDYKKRYAGHGQRYRAQGGSTNQQAFLGRGQHYKTNHWRPQGGKPWKGRGAPKRQ